MSSKINTRKLGFLIPVIVLIIIVLLFVWQYNKQKASEDMYTGTIEAEESLIGSTVGGRVSETLAKEGDNVKKGDRIVTFESVQLEKSLQAAIAAQQQAAARLNDLLAGPRPEEIERARAALRQAESQLEKLQRGSRPEEIAAARAAMEQARDRLAEAKAGPRPQEINRAHANYNAAVAARVLAERSLERTQKLYDQGVIAAQTLDEARTRLETAQAEERSAKEQLNELLAGTRPEEIRAAMQAYNQARANYELVRKGPRLEDIRAAEESVAQARATLAELQAGSRPEQIAEARAALRQAEATVGQVRANVRERAVFAPRPGQIQTLNVQVGDIIQAGQTVATIVDPHDLYIKIYVPGGKLGNLQVGSRLPVVTDSGIRTTGVVEQIPVEAEFTPRNVQTKEERSLQVYAVKVRIPNPELKIRAGMSADVRLK
ncbi:MAG: HlyD family efflux transporter periplasmic adaptor subunit [Armatimonadota bacterium]